MTDKLDCVCFGEVLWDIFDERESASKEPIGRVFRRELGGAPANLAVGLAKLGMHASVIGGVGDDAFGAALRQLLAGEGVDTKHLLTLPGRTGLTFVTRSDKGEPNFLFYRHETADMALREEHITGAMAKASFCVVGTSTLMTPELRAATHKFLDAATKAKTDIIVDLNVRAHLWDDDSHMKGEIKELVARAKLIKASEGDLEALAGKRGMSWLEQNAKDATWLLTRGENGAAALGVHGQVTAPTKRVRCIDATGAGDAFLAGAIAVLSAAGARVGNAAWKDTKVWTRALELGHIMGAKAVSGVGAIAGLTGLESAKAKVELAKKG